MSEPLIDKAGRTYESLVALGKKLLPKKNKLGWFMPRSPGRPPGTKSKPKMQTLMPAEPAASIIAENGAAGSPQPSATDGTPHVSVPKFDDVDAALKSAPRDDSTAARAESLGAEIAEVSDNTTADTIIGIIQTGLILVGEEEGILSPAETLIMRKPLVRVLKKYNVGDNVMPAEVDLAMAFLAVIVSRLKKPKTATAFAKVKAWITNQWFSAKGRKLAAEVNQHTPAQ